jgi:hypothetical protein
MEETAMSAHILLAAADRLRVEGMTIADEQLAHILPLMSEHVNLLGRYEFDAHNPAVQTVISALPLRPMNEIVEQLGLGI